MPDCSPLFSDCQLLSTFTILDPLKMSMNDVQLLYATVIKSQHDHRPPFKFRPNFEATLPCRNFGEHYGSDSDILEIPDPISLKGSSITVNPFNTISATSTQDILDFSPPAVETSLSPCDMTLPLSNPPAPLSPPGDQMVDLTQPSVSNPSSSPTPPAVGTSLSPCDMTLPLSNPPAPLSPPGDQMDDPTRPSVSNPSSSPTPRLQPSSTFDPLLQDPVGVVDLRVKAREQQLKKPAGRPKKRKGTISTLNTEATTGVDDVAVPPAVKKWKTVKDLTEPRRPSAR
jgi:hypothetical protein